MSKLNLRTPNTVFTKTYLNVGTVVIKDYTSQRNRNPSSMERKKEALRNVHAERIAALFNKPNRVSK
jgi:hypothetical protein